MKYNTIKNIIIATLSTVVFYMMLLDGISAGKKIFAVFMIFFAIWSLFDGIDADLDRRKPKLMTKKQFTRYKEKVAEKVEIRRTQGKDEAWIKNFIANYIAHDPRKIFTGPQINDLLSLAKENEKSASVGKPNALG